MVRSFDLVEEKVSEADFFLNKLSAPKCDFFEARCYFSAFAASSRSITFTLQAVMNEAEGFLEWYNQWQEKLKKDPIARFFLETRNLLQKIGINPVNTGSTSWDSRRNFYIRYQFNSSGEETPVPPENDVVKACTVYLTTLTELVYQCYIDFGPNIDPHQYYTQKHFRNIGKTIDDADEELFGVRGWTFVEGVPKEYRWQAIRGSVPGCSIDHIFDRYLGKSRPTPQRLLELPNPFAGDFYLPKALQRTGNPKNDLQLYFESIKQKRKPN